MASSQELIEVELTTLVYGGDALGRLPDGRAVFVPFGLPGERVRIRVSEDKKRYARAELVEILSPAVERNTPRCAHYGLCGGCHYQHLSYEEQSRAKTAILSDQLGRIGGITDTPVQPAASPQAWNYRNHVQFHLTTEGRLGFYGHTSNDADPILPIQECHLPQALINQVWPQLEFEGLPGLLQVGIRQGIDDDIQLILESEDPQPPHINIEELDVSVVHLSPAGDLVLAGSPTITMEVRGRIFQVSAGSFFQVNNAATDMLVDYLLEQITLPPGAEVLEVYCGVGLFSAFLAPDAGRLAGIEVSPEACSDFAVNLDEFNNVELYEAPAEDALPELDINPDLILVDPPRTGIPRHTLDQLVALAAPMLVYISCDPATLARDSRRLIQGGYKLESAKVFDLFPQTYHIESVNIFLK